MEIGVVGTFDLKQSWCIVGLFELFDMNDLASVSSPTDVTYAITNPGFEYRDLTGWTYDGFWYVGNNDNIGGKAGLGYIEYYRGGGLENNKYVSQTLTGLENGLYEVTVYGHQQQGTPNDGVKLYANSDYTFIGSTTKDYSVRTTVNNNELTIKIQTEGSTANWTAFDKFRLKFYGDPLAAYQDLLDDAVADAQALVNSNTIPDAAEAALQTIINANDNDDDAFTTESEFNTAIENINNAVSQYQDLVKPYALWLEAKSGAQALVLVDNNNATATSTLSGAIDTQNTAAEAATTSSDLNMATSALKSAILTFAGEADPTSGNRFDLTCLLTNHDLTGLPTWVGADGWFTDQVDGNSQVMTNDGVKSDDGKNAFYEYWSEAAKSNGEFTLYQKITLPVGTYAIKCYAFSDQPVGGDNRAIYFYANETQGSLVSTNKLTEQGISFINEAEQEVKIGLKALTGNTYRWMGIGYVQLFKEYTDNTTYGITVTSTNSTVATTVDGADATSAKALKTVTMTVTPTAGYAVSAISATYNDGTVKTLDVANPSTNVYTFQMPAYDVTVNITCAVDKSALATAISNANTTRKAANEGDGLFQIPADLGTALATALSTANGVNDNASATVSEVATATSALTDAITAYEGATLNAPSSSKRYNVTIVEDGKAWNGKAITFIAGGRTDMGLYGVKYKAPANDYMNQALKFTPVDGQLNTYKVSAINVETGGEQYLTTGTTYPDVEGNNNDQIRTTDDASKAVWVKIEAAAASGQFQMRNVTANKLIANNNNDDMYTANSCNFTIAEASEASVAMSIKAKKYATRIFPFTPSLPSGIKAYSISANDGASLTLKEVAEPKANVPYLLENTNDEDYAGAALTGYGTAAADSYTSGYLTGSFVTGTYVPQNSYVLQTPKGGKQGFYQVENENSIQLGQYRAYLTVPAAGDVKSFILDDDETDGIRVAEAEQDGTETIYTLSGQRVQKAQKGIYIVNGKKMLVK